MKTAYLALSYSQKDRLQPIVQAVVTTLQQHTIQTMVFVDKYDFAPEQEREMMATALQRNSAGKCSDCGRDL